MHVYFKQQQMQLYILSSFNYTNALKSLANFTSSTHTLCGRFAQNLSELLSFFYLGTLFNFAYTNLFQLQVVDVSCCVFFSEVTFHHILMYSAIQAP